MTNQELNESVAKKLGLDYVVDIKGNVLAREWKSQGNPFDPATDPEAALWALDRSLPEDTWIHTEWWARRVKGKVVYMLTINGITTEGTFCEVICENIHHTRLNEKATT